MASSRASTSAGRRRAQAKTQHRKRAAAGSHKPSSKRAAPPKKKSPPKKPKAPAKAARPRTLAAKATPRASVTRSLTIALVVGGVTLVLAAAYLFWFRDSSFVAIEKVAVEGMEGPEEGEATAALAAAAKKMTTLNVDETELAASVSGFPTVVAIDAHADFPHALTIEVTDRPPVILASDGGPPVAVAADGTLLPGVTVPEGSMPTLSVESVPAKGKLSGEPLALTEVAGAAPAPLLPLIENLSFGEDGLEVLLEGEVPVSFGDSTDAEAKWDAVAAILANPQVKTLTGLDVRVPERPSIGGAAPPAEEE